MQVDANDLRKSIRAGEVLHWMSPHWQGRHIFMILNGRWTPRNFVAEDAVHFRTDLGAHGWARIDGEILEGGDSVVYRESRLGP